MKKFKLFPIIIIICLALSAAAPAAFALEEPTLNAQAAILVDLDSGRTLYAKNADEQRSMASLTKIMTGLLALEAVERGEHSMDEMVTAGDDCQTGLDTDSSNVGLVTGEQMSFRDLLYCALISSGNDACNVIASYMAGDIPSFVALMNQRAAELGCTATSFADPNGLSSENHTSAYDLYLITAEAIKHTEFMAICNSAEHTVPATNVTEAREMHNSNALISASSVYGASYLYEYASGVKTGYTRAAGYCLVSTAEKEGVRTLAVVLGCDGWLNANIEEYKNFEDSRILYDWGFDNFAYRTVLTTEDPIERVNVELAKGEGLVILRPQTELSLLLPRDLDSGSVTTAATVYEDRLTAPIAAGTVLGEAKVLIDGQEYGTINLVNSTEVELAQGEYLKLRLKEIFTNGWVIAIILIVVTLAVVYIVLVVRYRRLRKKHLRERRLREQRRRQEQERLSREQAERGAQEPSRRTAGEDARPASPEKEPFDRDGMWK